MEGNPELLSVTQVASELGVTRQRVHDLIKNGQIIARKLGRFYYIEAAEVQRYKDKPTWKALPASYYSSSSNSIDE
jgi:excisionase family DNA binding protein